MKIFFRTMVIVLAVAACGQQPSTILATTPAAACCKNDTIRSARETAIANAGLVDIASLEESIMVHLVYATPYNFLGKVLYHDIHRAYLQPDVAEKLLKAYKILKKLRPDLTFIVYDAARPIGVQHEMWDMVKGSDWDYYVANPNKGGGMHNFGAAVDLTLIDCTGKLLEMGTPYDYFGPEANTDKEPDLVKNGRITPRELENRLLLRKVMTDAGFRTVKSEWWHFNACSLDEAKEKYKVIA